MISPSIRSHLRSRLSPLTPLIKNNTSITSGTPGYDDTRAQPGDTVIFKITSNEPLYEISTTDVTIDRMSVSSVTPNEDFTEWTVTSDDRAETSEDGPISYAITSYTDAVGNLGSSDGLLVDSKLEDITIDTKSPEIMTVTFDTLIKNNTSITSGTPGYDDTRAQPKDTVIFKITSNEPLTEISTTDVTIDR